VIVSKVCWVCKAFQRWWADSLASYPLADVFLGARWYKESQPRAGRHWLSGHDCVEASVGPAIEKGGPYYHLGAMIDTGVPSVRWVDCAELGACGCLVQVHIVPAREQSKGRDGDVWTQIFVFVRYVSH
jgi:hypothetical protein